MELHTSTTSAVPVNSIVTCSDAPSGSARLTWSCSNPNTDALAGMPVKHTDTPNIRLAIWRVGNQTQLVPCQMRPATGAECAQRQGSTHGTGALLHAACNPTWTSRLNPLCWQHMHTAVQHVTDANRTKFVVESIRSKQHMSLAQHDRQPCHMTPGQLLATLSMVKDDTVTRGNNTRPAVQLEHHSTLALAFTSHTKADSLGQLECTAGEAFC
jgi:hypothetical protein